MSIARTGLMVAMLALAGCSTMQHKHAASQPGGTAQKFILFFHPWSPDLTPEAKMVVDQAADVIKKTGPSTVTVAGYTDNDGSAADNQKLATGRVTTVQNALTADGIDPKLFLSIPLGAPEDTAGMTGDRRIEIRLTYGN